MSAPARQDEPATAATGPTTARTAPRAGPAAGCLP